MQGLDTVFKDESRRLLNARAFQFISPIVSPELLTEAETAWVQPAESNWGPLLSTDVQRTRGCLTLFPVSLPKSTRKGAMDTPLAPLLWFDIETVNASENRVKLSRSSMRLNLSLLCELSGLRRDSEHFDKIHVDQAVVAATAKPFSGFAGHGWSCGRVAARHDWWSSWRGRLVEPISIVLTAKSSDAHDDGVASSRGGGAGLTPGFPFHPRLAAGGTAGGAAGGVGRGRIKVFSLRNGLPVL